MEVCKLGDYMSKSDFGKKKNREPILQVLVATMNQTDHDLIRKMNLYTDAIIGNQCEKNSIEQFYIGDNKFQFLNFKERGVGLNRNNSLMRANADICLFADDDMIYLDDYERIVIEAFQSLTNADVIIFNLKEENPSRYIIEKIHRVRWYNYLRYGTARIAIKLRTIRLNGIYFNQCFGGGTEYSHGEDNLFLTSCLRAGLKIYAYPAVIAKLTEERESTWNSSYGEKYLRDQGILYRQISKRWWRFLCLQDALRRRKSYQLSWIKAYKIMTESI